MNEDFKIIKDHYGENFAKLCRKLFPTLLETKGLLSSLIMKNFADNHLLYEDLIESDNIEEFRNYIYSLCEVIKDNQVLDKTPKELLNDAGYILYECKTEEDIQSFKKYYEPSEELCTFGGGRLKTCYVFFAIKKELNGIKREDFPNPKRQDLYGTSVISIQFYRGNNNTVSIKNRYNHTVDNPDATFSNNLDNIINGLTNSFEKNYNLKIDNPENNDFELTNYIRTNDGKYYKFNYEINNVYYCPNNVIIIAGNPKTLDKSRYIVLDYFILDLKEKTLVSNSIDDSFVDAFKNIKNIKIYNNDDRKNIIIALKEGQNILIVLDKTNKIIKYDNENIATIRDQFLSINDSLRQVNLPNLRVVGNDFLLSNVLLEQVSFPKLTTAGNKFMYINTTLRDFYAPELQTVGSDFLPKKNHLEKLVLPKLSSVENCFLTFNSSLQQLDAPKLETIGNDFLTFNSSLKKLSVPNLKKVGNYVFTFNSSLQQLDAPNLTSLGNNFLTFNSAIKNLVKNITHQKIQEGRDEQKEEDDYNDSLLPDNLNKRR